MLDPYLDYLQQRWLAGWRNAAQLWRELQTAGDGGTRKQIEKWVEHRREEAAPSTPQRYRHSLPARRRSAPPNLPTPRRLVWVLLRHPQLRSPYDAPTLARIHQAREMATSYALAQQFLTMVRQRTPESLDRWLAASATSNVAELQTFASGLQQDYGAVRAALTELWSTGPVEGQINRINLVKRQLFGRANLDLLRQRVLHPV